MSNDAMALSVKREGVGCHNTFAQMAGVYVDRGLLLIGNSKLKATKNFVETHV